jgi:hypothetical protein
MRTISGGRRLFGTHKFVGVDLEAVEFKSASIGFNTGHSFKDFDCVTDFRISKCIASNCVIGPAIFENGLVRDFDGDPLFSRGAMFRRIKFVGNQPPLILGGPTTLRLNKDQYSAYEKAHALFYRNTDWAIDISEAALEDFSLRDNAIPTHLIIRDRESQFLVNTPTREQLDGTLRRRISDFTRVALETSLTNGSKTTLLVAPKRLPAEYQRVLKDSSTLADWII